MQDERGINQVKQETESVKATSPNLATTSADILRKTSFKILNKFSKIDAFHF